MFEKMISSLTRQSDSQDPGDSRRASVLNDVLKINLLVPIISLFLYWLSGAYKPFYILILIIFILLIFLLRFLLQLRKIDLAARILVYSYISLATIILASQGSLHSPFVSIYLLAILLTAILLEPVDLVVNSSLVILASGGISFAEYSGWISPSLETSILSVWLILGVICLVTIAFVRLPTQQFITEITNRLQAEKDARDNEQQIRSLYSTAQRQAQELALLEKTRLALAKELDLHTIIRTVVEGVAETFGYTLVSLYILQNGRLVLQHQVGYKNTIPEIHLDEGICGRVIHTQTPVLIEDVRSDPDFLGAISGIVSEVCVPLFNRGQIAGILNVESTQGVTLTEADLQLMIATSEHVSIAIERACLYDEISRSEEKYRILAESAPDMIYIHSKEGELTYINSSGVAQFGAQPEQLIGKRFDQLLEKQAAVNRLNNVQQVFETKKPVQTEELLTISDRSTWFESKLVPIRDQSGGVSAVLGISRDITDRKRTEAELQERAQELGALNALGRRVSSSLSIEEVIHAALGEIMPIVAPDLAMLFLSEGQELILRGFSPENPSNHQKFSTIHKVGECLCGLAAQTGEAIFANDLQMDNRCIYGDCINAGIKSFAGLPLVAENKIIGVLGLGSFRSREFKSAASFLETISNQVAAGLINALLHQQVHIHAQALEERVHQRTFELEMKNRELETFSYSVSHDLKAPLRGIDGYSQLLVEEFSKNMNEQGTAYLENIRYGIKKMSQLIDDLLAYSRLERRTVLRKQVDPTQMVDSIVAEWLNNPNNRASFLVDIPFESVDADPESLTQALRNLIDNAVKFSQDTLRPLIQIGGDEYEKSRIIWVHDNGIGFDMQYSDRIFEIFQRLNRDEDYPGTGIGLAMVRKAMERMGGRAWAESTPGSGSTFYLELPI